MLRWLAEQVAAEIQEDIGGDDGSWFLDQLGKAHVHASTGATISAADDSRYVVFG